MSPTEVRAVEGEVRRTTLPNGLTVLSEYMPGVRSVAFGATVRAASIHEDRDRMGVSHLLEHLVFKGTATRSAKEIALSLEALGGSLDAFTSREHTAYEARVLDEHLDHAVDIIGDLVFNPALRAADLALERKVVLEEIAMVDDTPDDLVFELQNEVLWGDHPYGFSILGTRDTVNRMRVGDLRELHQRVYHPAHVVIACAGSVVHDRLLEALERTGWLTDRPGNPKPLASPPPVPRPPEERHVDRPGAQTHIVLGSTGVPYRDPRRLPLLLLSILLGGGMSSRLFQRVREELGLAYAVHTYQTFHADTGTHGVYVGTAPETAGKALEAIREELRQVAEQGIPDDEIEMGKQQLKGQVTLALESVNARMHRLACEELYDEPHRTVGELLNRIDAVQRTDVVDIAAEYFAPDRMTVLSLGPRA